MGTIRIPVKVTTTLKTGSAPVICVCGRRIPARSTHSCSRTSR
jgi:hypothetical protein